MQQTPKFAKQQMNVDMNDLHIINHCRKSLLFCDDNTWKKKSTNYTMGGFDGSEICELVGLYTQSKLKKTKIKLWIIPRRWASFIKKS